MNQAHDPARLPDALAALRAATASRHERLDGGLPISGSAPLLADYAAHLRMVRDWLAPLQDWLDGYQDGPQAALPALERLALIDADLAEPGMPEESMAAARHPWPARASAAYRWGVCYVIEGSQLGGAVLYQRLAARLAPHPLRYLRGDGGGPGARWRLFTQSLRAELATEEQVAEACAGACAAFDSILAHAPGMGGEEKFERDVDSVLRRSS